MNKQVCKYSIIRFQPYPETEEFANIGIVLYATASKRLEFKLLESKQHARITHFFEPLSRDVFVQTSKIIHAEIDRIKKYLDETRADVDLYAELIRRREDIIRFSESRVLFCTDPAAAVNELFEHYIHRSFAHEPGHEEKMKRQVRDLLEHYNLGEKYREGVIGEPDKYEVKFPFVAKNKKQTVIKPIHFKHEKPSQLIDHGLSWLSKIQQLEKYLYIQPDEILFAYDAPDDDQGALFAAFNEIKDQIVKEGIEMADINGKEKIIKFAAS
jgi:hypothetical protein